MTASEWITLAFLVAFAVIDGGAVRIHELRVPAIAIYGQMVTFSCIYELDGPDDVLFSVKWYKDRKEFFRHSPASLDRKILTFPIEGVTVHVDSSDSQSVSIGPLTMESAGEYSCEVSLDAPTFMLVSSKRNVSVVVPSAYKPNITRLDSTYELNDVIDANCTSAPSTPTAKLRWLINGVEVNPKTAILQRPTESTMDIITEPPNPKPTWLGIRLRANRNLFQHHDLLELTCESQVSVLPPLQRVERVRLRWPSTEPDIAPSVGSLGQDGDRDRDRDRANDQLAQFSSPMKSGSSGWTTDMKTTFLIMCTSIKVIYELLTI